MSLAIDYTKVGLKAQALVEANGRTVTLWRRSRVAADPAMPWRGNTAADQDIQAVAVFSDYSAAQINGTTIRAGDKIALVAALSVTPEDLATFDSLVDGATGEWEIESVNTVQPGDTALLFELQLRKKGIEG